MECPQCQFNNPPGANSCLNCNSPVPALIGTMTHEAMEGWSAPLAMESAEMSGRSLQTLQPGIMLSGRYEILQLLGQGGMGAVYKAKDHELDRSVALKVIQPDLAGQAGILRRFKQELILARQVTHKNVIRIFDLGEAEGMKFITMEHVDGQDLKAMLDQRCKFAPDEAITIIEQVCHALDAAHSAGVVHRDLKPQNIMVDKQGKVSVMDFGVARSVEVSGLSQTGALIGTPGYMSPEQAKGEKLDGRSDLFSLGIIFYELLTGQVPFQAQTTVASLLKRITERAVPPIELDQSLPQYLSDVVAKCLEVDPQHRYQSALEIVQDLEAARAKSSRKKVMNLFPSGLRWAPAPRKWVVGGLAVLMLAIAGFISVQKIFFSPSAKQATSVEQISLAILPFTNASHDRSLDWLGPSLSEMLRTEVGQSSSLRSVSLYRLHQILQDLRISADSNFDPATVRRIAEFSSAETVMWGQYLKLGSEIRIDATLQDLKRQRTITLKAVASNENDILAAIAQLAHSIQQNLAVSPGQGKAEQAKSIKPSSQSIQALRNYTEGLEFARQGNDLEALKKFQASVQDDPQFALAYSKLAQTHAKLGYSSEAEQNSRRAVDLSDNLLPQEKYLILATDAQIANDQQKAIDSYENLIKIIPDDPQIHFDLGGLREAMGSFDLAREQYAKVLAQDPKYVDALLAAGRVEIKRGSPQGSLEYLNRALSLAIQLENQQGKATALQAMGVAYKDMNKPGEALRYYNESLDIKRQIGDQRGIAASLNEIAQIQDFLGKKDAALVSYQESLQVRRKIRDKAGVGNTLIDLGTFYQQSGQYDQALSLFKESLQIQLGIGNENYEALCLNSIGNVYFSQVQYDDALTYYERALRLREKSKVPVEIAETVFNLAETSSKVGQYEQAVKYYLRALELYRSADDKRGVAVASYGMGNLFENQGRYRAALDAKEEALKTFRQIQDRQWLAEVLSGYGNTLSLMGRWEEAQKTLAEALLLAQELQNKPLIAQTLNFQGDNFFYRGDYKSSKGLFEQALQLISPTADRYLALVSKINLAKASVKDRRSQGAINTLRKLAQECDALRLKYLSTECSLYLGEALISTKDYSAAGQELDAARRRSESMELRPFLARSDYLLARALQLAGRGAEAIRHEEDARRVIEEIHKEAASDDILKRDDLGPIYAQLSRSRQK
jgi:eukaryotic-like serine/threonine-protein kinase